MVIKQQKGWKVIVHVFSSQKFYSYIFVFFRSSFVKLPPLGSFMSASSWMKLYERFVVKITHQRKQEC